MNNRAVLDK